MSQSCRALTPLEFARARRILMRRDPKLSALIKRVGPCRLPESRTRHPFAALVRAVIAQQLSGKAAQTIHDRVVALVEPVWPLCGASGTRRLSIWRAV